MVTKKVLAVAAAAMMAVPVIAMPASAADGDKIQVGGNTVRLVTDFDYMQTGILLGQSGANGDKHCLSSNFKTTLLNLTIADKVGINGSKAASFSVTKDYSDKNARQDGIQYLLEKSPDQDPSYLNYEGATDVIFWVDCTNETADQPAVNVNFTEWDYNEDGTEAMVPSEDDNTKMVHKETTRNLADDKTNAFYILPDGQNQWIKSSDYENKGTVGWLAYLPKKFKGYVKCPLSDFDLTWSTTDNNNKIDLKHVTKFGVFYGMYQRHLNNPIYFDNLGFVMGDQSSTTTTNTAPTQATSNNGSVTNSNGNTNTNGNTSGNGNASSDNGNGSSASNSTSSSNPGTGEAPITAALLTAAVFTGVLVASKKRNRK